MDVITTGYGVDPLAVQSCEEKKPIAEGEKLSHLFSTGIKTECVDYSCDVTSDVKFEDTPVPVNFPKLKYETKEELCDVDTVQEELKPKVMAEEDEVLTARVSPECYRTAQEDHVTVGQSSNNCESSNKSPGESSSNCQNSERCFTEKHKIKTQKRSVETKTERRSKCDICNKVLATAASLRRHLRSHTGMKPFKCDICGKCLTEKGKLNYHMRMHTGEKPFKCDICGKFFSLDYSLKVHARLHAGDKPYTCNVCGSRFSRSGHLKIHARIHSGEKPFKCEFCGKGFADSGYLRVHKRRHTGEKPFKCGICGKCFSESGRVKLHARQHAKGNLYLNKNVTL